MPRSRGRARWIVAPVLLAIWLTGLAACERASSATIDVDHVTALADEPVHLRVTGLRPGEQVEISAVARDYQSAEWRSHASFAADDAGMVDLERDAPTGGSYQGVDGMGLFWSMDPPAPASADESGYLPLFPEVSPSYDVTIRAEPRDSAAATLILHRGWLTTGVTHARLELGPDKVIGDVFRPAGAVPVKPGVLLVGGSEGGISTKYRAALLASRGIPALALGYFAMDGLPAELRDIPIEYFAAAARTLPQPVRVIGFSRGSEAALLLSALYPDLVHGTVVYAPADHVWAAFPPPGNAWTYRGRPVTTIAFEQITGPVLAIAGTDDQLWPAAVAAVTVARATSGQSILCDGAGHGVSGLPYLAAGVAPRHPVTGQTVELGGSRPANAAGQVTGWTRTLELVSRP